MLCELNNSVVPKEEKVDKNLDFVYYTYGKFTATLPKNFDIPKDMQYTLISMNDRGESFEKIADYIEKKLLKKD